METKTTSYEEKIRDYFYRQYELEEGTIEENVRNLFADDLIMDLGEGKTGGIEMILTGAKTMRQTPKAGRVVELSDFQEDGNTVTYRNYHKASHPETGELMETNSEITVTFNEEGKIATGRFSQVASMNKLLRQLGNEIE